MSRARTPPLCVQDGGNEAHGSNSAGALGVPVWILLQEHSDWRWMDDREDTPWYPTMRLFRQRGGGWPELIARVADELRALAIQRAPQLPTT